MPETMTSELAGLFSELAVATRRTPRPGYPMLIDREVHYRGARRREDPPLPEECLAALVRDARSRLSLTPQNSGVREIAATFGDAVEARVSMSTLLPGPEGSPRLTPFGVCWRATLAAFPTLERDHADAAAAGHARGDFDLLDPAARRRPSLACLRALVRVYLGDAFREFLGYATGPRGAKADVLEYLHDRCLRAASDALRDAGVGVSPLPPPDALVERLFAACRTHD